MPIELKPCPFCGGEAKIALAKPRFMLKKYQNRYVMAGCPNCGVATRLFPANNRTGSPLLNERNEKKAKEEAAEAWNRRADDATD